MIDTMANGHLELWRIQSKRTLGANGPLKEMGTGAHRQMAKEHSGQMSIEVNWSWGKLAVGKN